MISKRRQLAYERAEETCRALRTLITMRVVDQTQRDWDLVSHLLIRWMDVSGKSKYDKPKVPRSFKRP